MAVRVWIHNGSIRNSFDPSFLLDTPFTNQWIYNEKPVSKMPSIWARIFKRLWSPGINSDGPIPPAYVAWRDGSTNRVVVQARHAGNWFLGFLKGLQIRALIAFCRGQWRPCCSWAGKLSYCHTGGHFQVGFIVFLKCPTNRITSKKYDETMKHFLFNCSITKPWKPYSIMPRN